MLSLAGNSLRTLLNINWEEDIPYGQTTNISAYLVLSQSFLF